ncbi:hypothetical protein Ga0100231_004255 [Opitutaceae bacterium TAV4]|nr:hypothetical protein Ga0100231_004255 [Opitutaceae bacterium TAV4]RRK02243.1 hypothetical protein Ga0100230_003440 [Opitutaceae bacterium TAV3]
MPFRNPMKFLHYFPLHRLLILLAITLPDLTTTTAATASSDTGTRLPENVSSLIDQAHREIWRRFITPDGTLLDYTGLDGQTILPTAEQCRENQPNGFGWWTPIENGAFFNGLYMDALVSRWEITREADIAAKARKLAAGLEKLATVSGTPGFIARGFADDGKTVYPLSSEDQVYPWYYGMWRYLKSAIPSQAEKTRLTQLVETTTAGLEAVRWKIPPAREGFGFNGDLTAPHFDPSVRLLFILRATHDLGGNTKWATIYKQKALEIPRTQKPARIDICAAGSDYIAPGISPKYPDHPPIWTSASSQAGLRALRDMEKDDAIAQKYQSGLAQSARNALANLKRWREFNETTAASMQFDIDWRPLNQTSSGWVPQESQGAAFKLGLHQYGQWRRISPRRIYENDFMRDPLFAAWVVFLSDDAESLAIARQEFPQALSKYRWDQLYTACFFMAENACWRMAQHTP